MFDLSDVQEGLFADDFLLLFLGGKELGVEFGDGLIRFSIGREETVDRREGSANQSTAKEAISITPCQFHHRFDLKGKIERIHAFSYDGSE